jgi:solute:Na+ symporter, SSS family
MGMGASGISMYAMAKLMQVLLVILPGMIAIALTYQGGISGFKLPVKGNSFDYDMAIPLMPGHYLPSGVLGLGLTALIASFMSGMAGNVTAFNTVWPSVCSRGDPRSINIP